MERPSAVMTADELARRLEDRPTASDPWSLASLRGLVCEVSSSTSGSLSVALATVARAQAEGAVCAFVAGRDEIFFPPDAARLGVALEALPVVRLRDIRSAMRAASHLVRSRGFDLVVLDLGNAEEVSRPALAHLASQARHSGTALLALTAKPASWPSLGSWVSVRVQVDAAPVGGGLWRVRIEGVKDRRRNPGWIREEVWRGPDLVPRTGSAGSAGHLPPPSRLAIRAGGGDLRSGSARPGDGLLGARP